MKSFAFMMRLQLRRLVRQKALVACLLLLPLAALLLGLLLPRQSAAAMQVGVYLPQNDPKAEEMWECLSRYSDEQVLFVRAQSPQQVEQLVAGRAWETGYILHQMPDNGKFTRSITRVSSPASIHLFMNWAVTASMLEVYAPELALASLEATGVLAPEQQAHWQTLAAEYFGPQNEIEVDISLTTGTQLQAGGSSFLLAGASLTRGMLALLLFLFAALCAVRFAQDAASGFYLRLKPYTPVARLFFPAYTAAMLLGLVCGLLSLGVMRLFFPQAMLGAVPEILYLLLYAVYLGCVAYLLAALFRAGDTLPAILPFLPVGCLLFCPILFDISQYLPAAKPLAYLLPPTLYLRAISGHRAAALAMLPAGALCLAAGLLITRLQDKRKPIEP